MSNETTDYNTESRPEWDHLEDWLRGQVQGMVQYMLEEEVTEFLGRLKSARRSDADNDSGYRNGYAPARKLTLSSGTIRVRRPRVRDTEERFVSRLLPLFVSRTTRVSELIPELYLHGLSEGDFDLALRGLLGDDAPLSASTVSRLKEDGTSSLPSGADAVSMSSRWSTCGWTGYMLRPALSVRSPRCWWRSER